MSVSFEEQHSKWVEDLQVGDMVCDSSYTHQHIVYLSCQYLLKRWVQFFLLWLPRFLRVPIWLHIERRGYRHLTLLHDKTLFLMDGKFVSARYDCFPANHAIDWPCKIK